MDMYSNGNNQPGPGTAALGGIPPGAPIFVFRGGAATWFGTQLLGVLITVLTVGICYPFAVVLVERWRANNTLLLGGRCNSSAPGGASSVCGSSGSCCASSPWASTASGCARD
jgi:hypothetical protein